MKKLYTLLRAALTVVAAGTVSQVFAETLTLDFSNPTAGNIRPDWNSRLTTVGIDGTDYQLVCTRSDGTMLPPGANTWGGNCLQWGNNSDFASHGTFEITLSPGLADVSEIQLVAAQTVAGAEGSIGAGVRSEADDEFVPFICAGSDKAALSTANNSFNTYTFTSKQSYSGTVCITGSVEGAFSLRSIRIVYNEEIHPDVNLLEFDFAAASVLTAPDPNTIVYDNEGSLYTFISSGTASLASGAIALGETADGALTLTLDDELYDVVQVTVGSSAPSGSYSVSIVDGELDNVFTVNGFDECKSSASKTTQTFAINHSVSGKLQLRFTGTTAANVYYLSVRHNLPTAAPFDIVLDYSTFTNNSNGSFVTDAGGFTYGIRELLHESPFMWWCDTDGWQGIQFGSTGSHIDEFTLRLSAGLGNISAVTIDMLAREEAAVRVYSRTADGAADNVLECRGSGLVNIVPDYISYTFTANKPFDGRLYIGGLGQSFVRIRNITLHSEALSGVEEVAVDTAAAAADDRCYDITGRPVDDSYRGIVISRGKKILR